MDKYTYEEYYSQEYLPGPALNNNKEYYGPGPVLYNNKENIIKFTKELFNKIKTNKVSTSLITIKIIIIIFLVIVSIYNKDVDYIKEKPVNFFIETLVCGLCGGISTLYVCIYSTGISKSSIIENFDIFILGFCLYASINIVLQISGTYTLLYQPDMTHNKTVLLETTPNKILNGFTYSIYVIMIIGSLLLIGNFLYMFYYSKKIDYKHYSFLFLQAIIMGMIHLAPLMILSYNRHGGSLIGSDNKNVFINIFKVGILFFIIKLSSSIE